MSKVSAIQACRNLLSLTAAFIQEEEIDKAMGAMSLIAETMMEEGILPGDIESLLVVQNPNDEDMASDEDVKQGLFARLNSHMEEVRGVEEQGE